MSQNLRLLVVEGNPRVNCERAIAHGAVTAGDRYVLSLQAVCPDVQIDKIYGAEPDCALPSGSEIASYDGIVIGGSGLHAYHDELPVTRQIDFVRTAFGAGVPILGSCWGMQIAVIAAGGIVVHSPRGREVGIARKVALSPAGAGHPMFDGKPTVFDTPCIHLDEVSHVPDGAVVLASNQHSRVQAIAFSSQGTEFWGVQYHPEFNISHIAKLAVMYGEMMIEDGFYTDMDDARRHAGLMEDLFTDPARFDLAWKLGIDRDVLDDAIRMREIRNWIELQVKPRKASRS